MRSNNLRIARRYVDELWSRMNLPVVDVLVAKQCKLRDPLFGEGTGLDVVKAQVCEMHQAFPDLAYKIEEVMADAGDQLALRWSARGTHRGLFLGVPATDRTIAISGMLLLRFARGKLIAITSCWEPYSMLEQLGLVAAARTADPAAAAARADAPVADAPAPAHDRVPAVDVNLLCQAEVAVARRPSIDLDAGWEL